MVFLRKLDGLGSHIRDIRNGLGWSQIELANKIKESGHKGSINQSMIAQYECGSVKNPNMEILQAISKVCGVPYTDFIVLHIKDECAGYGITCSNLVSIIKTEDLEKEIKARQNKYN